MSISLTVAMPAGGALLAASWVLDDASPADIWPTARLPARARAVRVLCTRVAPRSELRQDGTNAWARGTQQAQ